MANDKIEIDIILKRINKANADIGKLEKRFRDTEKTTKKLSGGLGTLRSAYLLVAAAAVTVGAGLVKTIKLASDFEETVSKFNTVFKDVKKEADSMAKNLQDNFGLSKLASQELLSGTGDLLTGFNFTQEAALDLSNQVQELAVDLASFTNAQGGAKAVSDALTKAVIGEREALKTYGIAILEADVKARVLENTQKGVTFETERQAKAFATLELAQEQSKNAIGDFARTSGGFANQMRILANNIEDVAIAIGTNLIQVLGPLVNKINDLFSITGKSNSALRQFRQATEEVAEAQRELNEANDEASRQSAEVNLLSARVELRKATQNLKDEQIRLNDEIKNGTALEQVAVEEVKRATEERNKLNTQLEATQTALKNTFITGEVRNGLLKEEERLTQGLLNVQSTLDGARALADEKEAKRLKLKELNLALSGKQTKANKEQEESVDDLTEAQEKNTKTARDVVDAFVDSGFATIGALEQSYNGANSELQTLLDKQLISIEEFEKAKQQIEESFESRRKERIMSSAEFAVEMASQTLDLISGFIQNEIDAIQRAEDKKREEITETFDDQKAALKKQHEDGLITTEEFNDGIEALDTELNDELTKNEKDAARKKKELRDKQFKAQQAQSVIDIAVNSAVAVSQAFAQLGPIGGAVAAAFIGAMQIAQTALVLSKKPPAFAEGTPEGGFITNGPQLIMVGDNPGGQERVDVSPIGSGSRDISNSSALTIENMTVFTDGAMDFADQMEQLAEDTNTRFLKR